MVCSTCFRVFFTCSTCFGVFFSCSTYFGLFFTCSTCFCGVFHLLHLFWGVFHLQHLFLGCISIFRLTVHGTDTFHGCISLLQSLPEALLSLRCPLIQSSPQALSHSAAELPEDLLSYMSSPWSSPKIPVSHDHTHIPHQAALLTCLETLLFQPAARKRQLGIDFRSSYLKYPVLLFKADSVQATHPPGDV